MVTQEECLREIKGTLSSSQLVGLSDVDVSKDEWWGTCTAKIKSQSFGLNIHKESVREKIAGIDIYEDKVVVLPKYPLNVRKFELRF